MAWYIFPAHYVCHLQPTLTYGTQDDNYPKSNIRTLNYNFRARIGPDAVNGMEVRFDRGNATNPKALNSILILNNTMAGSTWSVEGDTTSTFPTPTTLIASNGTISQHIWKLFDASATSTHRYIRFRWAQTSGSYYFGLLSFGYSYQVSAYGPLIDPEALSAEAAGPMNGLERWSRTFRAGNSISNALTRATVETIVDEMSRNYIFDGGGTVIDGFGGAGGSNPIALINSSTSPASIYYGKSRVGGKPWQPNYSDLAVDMTLMRPGLSV